MKINKILAAGVAATLAVSSLSAVVSAEKQTREFEIWINQAAFPDQTKTIAAEVNRDIANNLMQSYVQVLTFLDVNDNLAKLKLANGTSLGIYCDAIGLKVTGFNGTQSVTKDFVLKKGTTENIKDLPANVQKQVENKWFIVVLDKKTPVYHEGEFASFYFDRITDMSISLTIKANKTIDEDVYKQWNKDGNNFDIGRIEITDFYKADDAEGRGNSGHLWTFGTKNRNDVAVKDGLSDYGYVKSIQASERNTVIPETRGILVGSTVTEANVGNELTQAQGTFTITKATVNNYKKAADAETITPVTAGDTKLLLTDVVTVSAEKPVVYAGELISTGYLYPITDAVTAANNKKLWIYSTTEITATTKCKGTNTADALKDYVAAIPAAAKKSTDIAKETGFTVYVTDGTRAVAEEFDKNDYDLVTSANISPAGGVAMVDEEGTALAAPYNAAAKLATKVVLKYKDGTYGYTEAATPQAFTGKKLSDTDSTAALLAYAFANGGWFVSEDRYFDSRNEYIKGAGTLTKLPGWLPVTVTAPYDNGSNGHDGKTTIRRNDVWNLSSTNATTSTGRGYEKNEDNDKYDGHGQSYEEAMTKGTLPIGFVGLAGQVAEFFNFKDNGEITFQFTAAAAAGGNAAWQSGIPSTEVGLIGSGAGQITSNFALFFNYNSTGGMMVSPVKVDPTAGTVTFDITDYLKDSGTLTKATLHDIYYGLNVGSHQYDGDKGDWGLWVNKVILSYEDAPAAAADAAAADDDAAAVVDADDDDDTAAVVDEDDDDDDDDDAAIIADDDDDDDDDDTAAVISDDDEDDSAAAGDVDVVTPAGNDTNPATGVGLAVIPAIVAAAAMAISKKRK